jgi:hypothetical protein
MPDAFKLWHRGDATPPIDAARSSKMTRSSAPEFRIKDGSRFHSGESAQSLNVLIPARRVAQLPRGTRSRTYAHGPSCRRWRLQDWHPIFRDPRPALLSGQTAAWPSRRRRRQKDSRRSHTGSRTEHGAPRSTRPGFGLIRRDNSRLGHWNSSTSMAKFLFQQP